MSTHHPITLLGTPEQESFLIGSQNQRQNLINMIITKEIPVTVHLVDDTKKTTVNFSTRLLGIDPENGSLIFETTPDEPLNQQISEATMLYCASTINDVPIEFMLDAPHQEKCTDKMCFITPFPQLLIRMQRREFFRINIPQGISAICYFPTDTTPVKTELADISIGGFSILVHGDCHLSFKVDDIIEACEIQLSLNDGFKTTLKVKNNIVKSNNNSETTTLIGFTFIDISASIESQIQRFIFNIESKRLRTR
ncbi:MAG: flagellar brake protein [Gammaproteobacteria bacterium]|nr:flagellar brake protein [Gammaproteobacteria bacterium]MCF6229290.1 flagellar brake protein [Gammaproteobacteria bacterium]